MQVYQQQSDQSKAEPDLGPDLSSWRAAVERSKRADNHDRACIATCYSLSLTHVAIFYMEVSVKASDGTIRYGSMLMNDCDHHHRTDDAMMPILSNEMRTKK